MVTTGLLLRLHARPGKGSDTAQFLEGVMPLIRQEPATFAFFAIRFGPSEFGIFNAFPDAAGREAHTGGPAAAALFSRAEELFTASPSIESVEILQAKLPGEDER